MRIRRKWTIIVALLMGVPAVLWLAVFLTAPPVSADAVRAEILALTPLGCTAEEIEKAIEKMQEREAFWQVDNEGKKRETSVDYRTFYQWRSLPFETHIAVHWHLNTEGRLQEISLKYYVLTFLAMKEVPPP
jgi:hypothetical protein